MACWGCSVFGLFLLFWGTLGTGRMTDFFQSRHSAFLACSRKKKLAMCYIIHYKGWDVTTRKTGGSNISTSVARTFFRKEHWWNLSLILIIINQSKPHDSVLIFVHALDMDWMHPRHTYFARHLEFGHVWRSLPTFSFTCHQNARSQISGSWLLELSKNF